MLTCLNLCYGYLDKTPCAQVRFREWLTINFNLIHIGRIFEKKSGAFLAEHAPYGIDYGIDEKFYLTS